MLLITLSKYYVNYQVCYVPSSKLSTLVTKLEFYCSINSLSLGFFLNL